MIAGRVQTNQLSAFKDKAPLMHLIRILPILFVSINLSGQNLSSCGIDDNPNLSTIESEFLNSYMSPDQKKGFDFTGKKALFVTGSTGQIRGRKSVYFDGIKVLDKKGDRIATSIVALNDREKAASGGYDVIITYWVKYLPNHRKRKIIKQLIADL